MISEKKKLSNRKWDKKNMKTVACFIKKEDAELFKKICNENGTTPAQHLKRHIAEVIEKYYEDNAGK